MVADTPPGTLYEGVRQLRGIALLGDAYVVFDRVVCDAAAHHRPLPVGQGPGRRSDSRPAPGSRAGENPGGRAVQGHRRRPCGKELRVDFENGLKSCGWSPIRT